MQQLEQQTKTATTKKKKRNGYSLKRTINISMIMRRMGANATATATTWPKSMAMNTFNIRMKQIELGPITKGTKRGGNRKEHKKPTYTSHTFPHYILTRSNWSKYIAFGVTSFDRQYFQWSFDWFQRAKSFASSWLQILPLTSRSNFHPFTK